MKREIFRAAEIDEAVSFSKYDENTDKLYLMMAYRNNPRRVAKKGWESSWKVVPNYECWQKYFKNNENNLANLQYYDLDYDKIGNIEENTRTYSLKNGQNGAIIVNKELSAGNKSQQVLYSIKNDTVFGVNQHRFFG